MKCSKCGYLSFDAADRCRNCGYAFPPAGETATRMDGPLRDSAAVDGPLPELSLREEGAATGEAARAQRGAGLDLPLFHEPIPGLDDTPLISTPAPPRAPLAVRRATPDPSRLPRPARAREPQAPTPPAIAPPPVATPSARPRPRSSRSSPDLLESVDSGPEPTLAATEPEPEAAPRAAVPGAPEAAPAGARLGALAVDLLLLAAIDAAVVQFTLSIVRYPWSRLGELPLMPLLAFCAMLDAGYVVLLTGASGQTLGKMLSRIRVAGAASSRVTMTQAALRTALAPLSLVTLGLGYLPALVGRDRRALHDRLSGTRVLRM